MSDLISSNFVRIRVARATERERDLETCACVRQCACVLQEHPDWPVSVNQPINFQCGRAFISSPETN